MAGGTKKEREKGGEEIEEEREGEAQRGGLVEVAEKRGKWKQSTVRKRNNNCRHLWRLIYFSLFYFFEAMPDIEIYFSYSFMQTCILPFILYLLFF